MIKNRYAAYYLSTIFYERTCSFQTESSLAVDRRKSMCNTIDLLVHLRIDLSRKKTASFRHGKIRIYCEGAIQKTCVSVSGENLNKCQNKCAGLGLLSTGGLSSSITAVAVVALVEIKAPAAAPTEEAPLVARATLPFLCALPNPTERLHTVEL